MARSIGRLLPPWLRALTPYPPGKPIDEVEREYGIRDSIKLASNENPLGPSPRALVAAQAALADLHRYPDGGAYHLRRRLAEKFGLSAERFIVGNGSNEIIELVIRAFVRPGDEVVMADQAFVIYRMIVQAVAGTPRLVPLSNYVHDLEAMAATVTRRTRAVFLANPNNPTGTIYGRTAWERFLDAVPRDVLVVADEAYAEFVDDADYPDSLAYQDGPRLLVTLRTFSKIHGLAGLRIGFGVSTPEVIDALHRIRQPFNVNSVAQAAARAALDDDEHVARTRAATRAGMRYLAAECERFDLDVVPSAANFLLIDVGDGAQVYEALLRDGVIVRPMGFYGFTRHIRVTIGTPAENERFIAALARALGRGGVTVKAAARGGEAESGSAAAGAEPGVATRGEEPRASAVFARAAVLGVGLIGGSLGCAARRAGLVGRVVGYSRSAETLRVALARGLVDEGAGTIADAVRDADLIVLAVPVGDIVPVAEAMRAHLRPGAVVTDVGSVKGDIVARLDSLCRSVGCSFVGAHPIAGKEQRGPEAAEPSLFRDERCILTPTATTDRNALARIRTLWEGVGMRVEEMDPDIHDRILARVSHAPHLVAYALAAAVGAGRVGTHPLAPYAGPGFRDTTRIAASPGHLWRDIALANRAEIMAALDEFETRLAELRDLLQRGDAVGLERAFERAASERRALDEQA